VGVWLALGLHSRPVLPLKCRFRGRRSAFSRGPPFSRVDSGCKNGKRPGLSYGGRSWPSAVGLFQGNAKTPLKYSSWVIRIVLCVWHCRGTPLEAPIQHGEKRCFLCDGDRPTRGRWRNSFVVRCRPQLLVNRVTVERGSRDGVARWSGRATGSPRPICSDGENKIERLGSR